MKNPRYVSFGQCINYPRGELSSVNCRRWTTYYIQCVVARVSSVKIIQQIILSNQLNNISFIRLFFMKYANNLEINIKYVSHHSAKRLTHHFVTISLPRNMSFTLWIFFNLLKMFMNHLSTDYYANETCAVFCIYFPRSVVSPI